jgi:putative phosphoribosyl transferase
LIWIKAGRRAAAELEQWRRQRRQSSSIMRFTDRKEAGQALARKLSHLEDRQPVVLALPRGGVPVGFEVARALGSPLDVALVRKIGVPWHPELAIGALAEGEAEPLIDWDMAEKLGVTRSDVTEIVAREAAVIAARRALYFRGRPPVDVAGAHAIVVDDGIATGATMRAALRAVRRRQPAALILAVPVAPPETIEALRAEADAIVCLAAPREFWAVGQFYADFSPVEDETVCDLLARAAA